MPSYNPGTIWITGLSASGKTTLGERLRADLARDGIRHVELFDGERVRPTLRRTYGYSAAERNAVILELGRLAGACNRKGKIAIVCAISHVKEIRDTVRRQLGAFMEVYLQCPVAVCARRDPKGHYARARTGQYDHFIGVTEPYQVSEHPELVLDTATLSVEACAEELHARALEFLRATETPKPVAVR